jgi:hypothetical protein
MYLAIASSHEHACVWALMNAIQADYIPGAVDVMTAVVMYVLI